jgi:coproporphyrinogen III oxidase
MNLRYLELAGGDAWFGGGTDLTPCYLFEEDARHFHGELKSVCDRHDSRYYPEFKRACDEYFFIKHRGEGRGVGGIFFDYQRQEPERFFAFVRELGERFLPAYLPIAGRRRSEPWGGHEREWQLVRRGRYVEFNLVYDRGTQFGLETKGRAESILLSLPPEVKWGYCLEPEAGSREAALLDVLRKPKEWA